MASRKNKLLEYYNAEPHNIGTADHLESIGTAIAVFVVIWIATSLVASIVNGGEPSGDTKLEIVQMIAVFGIPGVFAVLVYRGRLQRLRARCGRKRRNRNEKTKGTNEGSGKRDED